MKYFRLTIYGFVTILMVAILMLPAWVAQSSVNRLIEQQGKTRSISKANYWILIYRGIERMRASEIDTAPHRGSLMAIYTKNKKSLAKVSPDFRCRSRTTALYPPSNYDKQTVEKVAKRTSGYYVYGYQSVPQGSYQLTVQKDINHSEDARDRWLLISTWGWNNKILLDSNAQKLYSFKVNDSHQFDEYINHAQGQKPLYYKYDCFIHGTLTKFWSHVDSQGCINLYHRDSEPESSDFLRFVDSLKELGVYQENLVGELVIIERNIDVEKDKLPVLLTMEECYEMGFEGI